MRYVIAVYCKTHDLQTKGRATGAGEKAVRRIRQVGMAE